MKNSMDQSRFQTLAQNFLQKLGDSLRENRVDIEPHWDIDHICYRVGSLTRYNELKRAFCNFSDLLIESPVNGRPISTFKLHAPLTFEKWRIDLVELPAPKPQKPTVEGFEHIEVVCDSPFSHLKEKYRHLSINDAGLGKDFNQELEIGLGDLNIKFHHISLESVIRLEKNQTVFEALKASTLLSRYKQHEPLVAGTFPLGLDTPLSDIDILMKSSDFASLQKRLTEDFSIQPGFRIEMHSSRKEPCLVAEFLFHGVPFEIFAQDKSPLHQDGYRHFLAEERLLKWGGRSLRERLQAIRSQGVKTEAAFCLALNLSGDPFQQMLILQKKSWVELQFPNQNI